MSEGGGRHPAAGVVVVTRDRRQRLLATLDRLAELPEAPPIVVVDNGSRDGTALAVARRHPRVETISLARNAGAAARSIGARALDTELVAFNDDDSWWEPGALARAAASFAARPRLALLAARIVVEPDGRLDPTCERMRQSPLGRPPGMPGPAVLGFVACGAVVRRNAFLEVGGFHPRLGIGAEERLLALDLAAAGWELAYVDTVRAHHAPDADSERPDRIAAGLRNDLWTTWLRRRLPSALAHTATLTVHALRSGNAQTLLTAARGLPWILRERQPLPQPIEAAARAVERQPS